MPRVKAEVAYGYIRIGSQSRISNSVGRDLTPEDFLSSGAGLINIQVGTHTGVVEVDFSVVDAISADASGRAATGTTEFLIDDHRLFATTFHGMVAGFVVDLPDDWQRATVHAVSERYAEASTGGEFDDLEPPEVVVLQFAPA